MVAGAALAAGAAATDPCWAGAEGGRPPWGAERSAADRGGWSLGGDSSVGMRDLSAAVSAGRDSLGQGPVVGPGWSRLAELLGLDGKENEARGARERASQILASHDGGGGV